MGNTKTTQKSSLTSWADVDESLRVIALENAAVKKAEARMNEEVLAIQKRHEEETRGAREKVVANEKQIELYCIEHRDEFVGSKTKDLNYGTVSFRNPPAKLTLLHGFTWETVLALLKKLKMDQFVRMKEEVDKDAIKEQLPDAEELAQVGLRLAQNEQFYYETKEVEIV